MDKCITAMDLRQSITCLARGKSSVAKHLFGTASLGVMDKVMSPNCCRLGLLGVLLLLQGVFIVEGRSILNPGNQVLSKEDPGVLSKPVERNDPLGLELANRFVELEELEALREDLQLEKEIASNDFSEGKAMPRKRDGEPCFWKYCL